MNEEQAKQAFERGQIQPKCPACGKSMLMRGKQVKMTEKGTYNTTFVTGYQCMMCQDRFVAYIGKIPDGT